MGQVENELLTVKCWLSGDKEFVTELVEYLGERVKFKDDVCKMRDEGEEKVSVVVEFLGLFCNRKGKIKRAKGFRPKCVPNISLNDFE